MKPENSLDLELVELSFFGIGENSTPSNVYMMYAKNARAVPEVSSRKFASSTKG